MQNRLISKVWTSQNSYPYPIRKNGSVLLDPNYPRFTVPEIGELRRPVIDRCVRTRPPLILCMYSIKASSVSAPIPRHEPLRTKSLPYALPSYAWRISGRRQTLSRSVRYRKQHGLSASMAGYYARTNTYTDTCTSVMSVNAARRYLIVYGQLFATRFTVVDPFYCPIYGDCAESVKCHSTKFQNNRTNIEGWDRFWSEAQRLRGAPRGEINNLAPSDSADWRLLLMYSFGWIKR